MLFHPKPEEESFKVLSARTPQALAVAAAQGMHLLVQHGCRCEILSTDCSSSLLKTLISSSILASLMSQKVEENETEEKAVSSAKKTSVSELETVKGKTSRRKRE